MNIRLIASLILIITAGTSYCGGDRKINIVFSGSNNGYYRDCG